MALATVTPAQPLRKSGKIIILNPVVWQKKIFLPINSWPNMLGEKCSVFSVKAMVYPIASTLVIIILSVHFHKVTFSNIMFSFLTLHNAQKVTPERFLSPQRICWMQIQLTCLNMFEHIWTFFEPYLNAMRTQSLHQRICPRWSASFLPPARKKGVFFENGLLIIYQSWGYQVLGTNYIYIHY